MLMIVQLVGSPGGSVIKNPLVDAGDTRDGSKLGKEYVRAIYCTLLMNLYAKYIMRNASLEEAQAGIKIARRNISNLRSADDTTLMAESKEELKSLLMKVKEESEQVG